VADAAGVHVSTASRVINEAADAAVRPETRDRILAAADKLRYRPHAGARALKLASTAAVGYLVPSLRNPVNSAIMRSAVQRAWKRGLVVLIAEDTGEAAPNEAYERLVEEHRIDGLLIQSARGSDPFYARFEDGHVPCVFVDRAHAVAGRNVLMPEGKAGALAAAHFIGLGHRHLVHVAGPLDLDTVTRRREGFVTAASAAGCHVTVIEAELDERAGYDAFARVCAEAPEATAVYVANFNQAAGFAAHATAAGRAVPAELSVLSHDDDPLNAYLATPLSAIDMPLVELGVAAVDALVAQIEGEPARDVMLSAKPAIVDRGSTAPPRQSG
jgi:DNA-binding LacI/PurR family transcriptional regulator